MTAHRRPITERAARLSRDAEEQITQLIEVLSTCGEAGLRRRCPGREKLGDGTVAACAQHTADNYHRLVAIARHADTDALAGHGHSTRYSNANISLPALLAQLSAAQAAVAELSHMEDDELDSVPAAGTVRFADGQRTLEQLLAAALKHQAHQVDAVKAAVQQPGGEC